MLLSDFSFVKLSDSPSVTMSGGLFGTPYYMSPEQAQGQPVDKTTDIYSLAMVAFELLTGRVPFEGDNVLAVLVAVASEQPPAPRRLNPEVPPRLEDLIVHLLAKDPARRPASAQAVVAELEAIERELSGPPAVEATTTLLPAPAPGRRLPKRLLLVATAHVEDEIRSVLGVKPGQ